MSPLREAVKRYLVGQKCALCGGPASQLHEIVCPIKNKYQPDEEEELARLVYLPQNVVMLCPMCNTVIANSRRDDLIRYNMGLYGQDAVAGVYKSMARLLKAPSAWIPRSIIFEGKEVKLL